MTDRESTVDFQAISGLEHAKRALEVAAAGNHHVLLTGAPGVGKTLLAHALVGILPSLTPQEADELTALHRCAGLVSPDAGPLTQRPLCTPSAGMAAAALFGRATPSRREGGFRDSNRRGPAPKR